MGQIIAWIFLAALAIYAFQLALVVLILAGLIFRTKETIGLLLLGATITGFTAHPLIGSGLLIILIAFSLYLKKKEAREKAAAAAIDPYD